MVASVNPGDSLHLTDSTLDQDDDTQLIGYARVSTEEQNLDTQIAALVKAGVPEENIFSEKASAMKANRKQLANALRRAREGDTLVVYKLDRVVRSLRTMIALFDQLEAEGIKFRSLTEGIETETPGGRLILHVLGALGQFERELIVERSRDGVRRAQEAGVKFGATEKVTDAQIKMAWRKVNRRDNRLTRKAAADELDITTMTLSRRLKKLGLTRETKKKAVTRSKKVATKKSNT